MENKDSDDIVKGLVKHISFTDSAKQRNALVIGSTNDLMNEFFRNTARIIRVPGMSVPLGPEYKNADEKLCQIAIKVVLTEVLKKYDALHGIPFTVLDGTTWQDSVASPHWALDILYINVFWNGHNPIIAVMLGQRVRVKTSKIYFRDLPETQYSFVFEYNLNLPHAVNEEWIMQRVRMGRENLRGADIYRRQIVNAILTTALPEVEYPVAAAAYLDGVVWYADRPYRHHHIVHSTEYLKYMNRLDLTATPRIQGFLTNHGNFVTRYRAMYKAARNGMIIHSERTSIELGPLAHIRKIHPIEASMGGISLTEDNDLFGYRVAKTALFSEDLW